MLIRRARSRGQAAKTQVSRPRGGRSSFATAARPKLTSKTLHGVYAPIPTAFGANSQLSIDDTEFNTKKLNTTPLDGFVVMGSNGEFSSLTFEEKIKLMVLVKNSASPSKQLIAGTGTCSLNETLQLTNAAEKIGYDAAMVIPPYYFVNKMDDAALTDYYTKLADQSKLPIVLYNMPSYAGVNLSLKLVTTLSKHSNIIGIKDTGGSMEILWRTIHESAKEKFSVVGGSGSALVPALMYGATGGIMALANVVPDQCVKMHQLYKENKLTEANELQNSLIDLNRCITSDLGIPAVKYMMNRMGYRFLHPRSPLLPLSEAQQKQVDKVIAQYKLV